MPVTKTAHYFVICVIAKVIGYPENLNWRFLKRIEKPLPDFVSVWITKGVG